MSFKTYKVRVYDNGTKHWYLNGKLHREDGPAVECANGDKYWYLNGKLHREDGPAVKWADGDKWWYLNDKLHREDGPAWEWADGDKEWYLNGKLHRVDGPAVERANGDKFWYLNGNLLTKEEFNRRMNAFSLSSEVALWQLSTQCEETTAVGPCYDGKVVEIDGKKYRLTLEG